MKQMMAIVINDFRVEFSSRSAWLMLLVLPLIFAAVIGVATGGYGGDPNRDPRLPVMVANLDEGTLGSSWLAELEGSDLVRVESTNETHALEQLELNSITAAIVVPAGFTAELLAGNSVSVQLHQPAGSNTGHAVEQAVRAANTRIGQLLTTAAVSLQQAETQRPFDSDDLRLAYRNEAMTLADATAHEPTVRVEQEHAETAQPQVVGGFALSSPGQLVTWVLSTLLAGSELLTAERTRGTLRRLLVMPVRRAVVLSGKIVGRLALGLLQMVVLIAFGWSVLGVSWGRAPVALVLVAFSFGLAATALGMLIATISRTQSQASGLVTLGTFLLAPLGGAWVPLEITPRLFQQVAQVFPTTWAMRGFTDIIVRGQGVQGVLAECAVLLGMAVVIFVISIRRFRYE